MDGGLATEVLGETMTSETVCTHETDDDVDSDASENSDDIDKDFFGTLGAAASVPQPHRQSNSPTSRAGSPNTPSSPGIKRRMSMARPVVHHNLPGFVVDEKADSAFLADLTFMIAEFPIPPSHVHSIEPQTNNFGGIMSLAGSWFRPRNEGL
jgi:hypothetical protein